MSRPAAAAAACCAAAGDAVAAAVRMRRTRTGRCPSRSRRVRAAARAGRGRAARASAAAARRVVRLLGVVPVLLSVRLLPVRIAVPGRLRPGRTRRKGRPAAVRAACWPSSAAGTDPATAQAARTARADRVVLRLVVAHGRVFTLLRTAAGPRPCRPRPAVTARGRGCRPGRRRPGTSSAAGRARTRGRAACARARRVERLGERRRRVRLLGGAGGRLGRGPVAEVPLVSRRPLRRVCRGAIAVALPLSSAASMMA